MKTAIKEGQKYQVKNGIIWNIDSIKNNEVFTSMDHGKKGNYCDTLESVISFLNEQKGKLIN